MTKSEDFQNRVRKLVDRCKRLIKKEGVEVESTSFTTHKLEGKVRSATIGIHISYTEEKKQHACENRG